MKRIFEIDLRSLALFRMLLSLFMLGDLIVRVPEIVALHSDYGAVPRISVIENWWLPGTFSFHILSGDPAYMLGSRGEGCSVSPHSSAFTSAFANR